jgi:hypothetical protein
MEPLLDGVRRPAQHLTLLRFDSGPSLACATPQQGLLSPSQAGFVRANQRADTGTSRPAPCTTRLRHDGGVRVVSDEERRARLAVRHSLAGESRAASVEASVAAATCLHANVYLSAFARSDASRADMSRALYEDRSVVRQLAMRRTVFAFPRDLLPAVGERVGSGGCSARGPAGQGGRGKRARPRRREVGG